MRLTEMRRGGHDLRDLSAKVRAEGARGIARRAVRRAYSRMDAADLDFPLLPGDIAESSTIYRPVPPPVGPRPLRIGWVTTPPSAGSGGHTTMFRMIQAVEAAGHECTILLYDRHHGDPADHERRIRSNWPSVSARVASVDERHAVIDACVATGWQTAHVLAQRGLPGHAFYFIQDFEPYFYARGSEYQLAADTYRFGFTNIALGLMVTNRLASEVGAPAYTVPFSCDTDVYKLTNLGPRSGVVFYTKPGVPRRGYRLGALAMAEFHRRHPEQEIHVFGDASPGLDVPVTRHSRLTPAGLSALYNRTLGGLAMSFTNISLVAEEMLAAGCIPVVNDSTDARADIDGTYVAWATPSVGGMADALSMVVEDADPQGRAQRAAHAVRQDNWRNAGSDVVGIIESVVRGTVGQHRLHSARLR